MDSDESSDGENDDEVDTRSSKQTGRTPVDSFITLFSQQFLLFFTTIFTFV